MQAVLNYFLNYYKSKDLVYKKFITNSSVIFLFSATASFITYLFHIVSARYLDVDSYGILQTTIGIINLFTVVTVVIRLEYTKVLGSLIREGMTSKASLIFQKTSLSMLRIGTLLLIIALLINSLSNYKFGLLRPWHISISLIVGFFTILISAYRAMMRAHLKFLKLSVNVNFVAVLKFLLVLLLIFLDLKLPGIFAAIIISYTATYFFSRFQAKSLLSKKGALKLKISQLKIARNSIAVLIGYTGLVSLITSDLLLVQRYLPSEGGYYAGLLIFGKIIIFSTTPISTVLFPSLVSYKKWIERKNVILISLLLAAVISLSILAIYIFFPTQLITLTISSSYLKIAPLIPFYALFSIFHSISNILVNASIAIERYLPSYIAFAAAILQIIAIMLFHNSISEIIIISLGITTALVIFLLINIYKNTLKNASK